MTYQLLSEASLVSAAIALGAEEVAGISPAEIKLIGKTTPLDRKTALVLRSEIRDGTDPLGSAFSTLRSAEVRRECGATYTPEGIVNAMMAWAKEQSVPDRVVDPGVGSARFLCAAGRNFKNAHLLGLEVDPLAALMARANLAASGFASRSRIELLDYRAPSEQFNGRTLFIGNPPYVRHHLIDVEWKQWLVENAAKYKLKASQLAGLHLYFFLATVLRAAPGDSGAFITAAEWLDVNYGQLLRDLFLGPLGGKGIVIVEPTASPFPDAATTAAITTFQIGAKPTSVRLRRVKRMKDLVDLSGGKPVRRERLELESRWSRLTHADRGCPEGFVELGELCRVHRGTVTGANGVFIANSDASGVPDRYKLRSITKARELIAAGRVLADASALRSVVALPDDLSELNPDELDGVNRFLTAARLRGAHEGYVARNRRAWWSVGMRAPAPILATYMARSAPTFVRNVAQARHINIAHGLYPRDALSENQMRGLVDFLCTGISVLDGRTYAGGLTKFEPGEMERLFVPAPNLLAELGG
jgi:adenine-specific DNA-methyltransferase